mmetsp:Transcript_120060/g.346834  ORF Transcript_120060/g.346834 Transcript_120060/m.346834 type:complete len:279 (+) Transcript_120060:63-899(+)
MEARTNLSSRHPKALQTVIDAAVASTRHLAPPPLRHVALRRTPHKRWNERTRRSKSLKAGCQVLAAQRARASNFEPLLKARLVERVLALFRSAYLRLFVVLPHADGALGALFKHLRVELQRLGALLDRFRRCGFGCAQHALPHHLPKDVPGADHGQNEPDHENHIEGHVGLGGHDQARRRLPAWLLTAIAVLRDPVEPDNDNPDDVESKGDAILDADTERRSRSFRRGCVAAESLVNAMLQRVVKPDTEDDDGPSPQWHVALLVASICEGYNQPHVNR